MLEEFSLGPFSAAELRERIVEKYKDSLEYIKDNKQRFLELSSTPIQEREKKDEDYVNFDLGWHYHSERIAPLYNALSSGFVEAFKCDMIGGDDRPVSLTEKALKNAMNDPQLQGTAREIIRFMNTPSKTWEESVKGLDKSYSIDADVFLLDLPERGGYEVVGYKYIQSMVASGRKREKLNFLKTGVEGWQENVNAKLENLYDDIKRLGKIPIGALRELEELEYRRHVVERINNSVKERGLIKKPILLYTDRSVTILENNKWGYRFRGFGEAKPYLKSVEQKAIETGLRVQNVNESGMAALTDYRRFSLIDLKEQEDFLV